MVKKLFRADESRNLLGTEITKQVDLLIKGLLKQHPDISCRDMCSVIIDSATYCTCIENAMRRCKKKDLKK